MKEYTLTEDELAQILTVMSITSIETVAGKQEEMWFTISEAKDAILEDMRERDVVEASLKAYKGIRELIITGKRLN